MDNAAKTRRDKFLQGILFIICLLLTINLYSPAPAGQESNLSLSRNERYQGIDDISASISQETAQTAGRFADVTNSAVLWQKAQAESDPRIQEEIVYCAVRLDFQYADDKTDYLINFLHSLSWDNIHLRGKALNYLICKAEEIGIQEAVEPLAALKSRFFRDDSAMQTALDNAIDIIKLERGKDLSNPADLRAICTAALASQKEPLIEWAIRRLNQKNAPLAFKLANDLLIDGLFANKKGPSLEFLKDAMEKRGILRAENTNPSFEDTQESPLPDGYNSGFQPLKITPSPVGWQGEASQGKLNKIQCAEPDAIRAASYAKCLEINNAAGETRIVNDPVTFQGELPRAVEFGVSYIMNSSDNQLSEFSAAGADNNAPQWPITLSVRLIKVTLDDASVCPDAGEIEGTSPDSYNWQRLSGDYTAPLGRHIRSLQLELTVRGNGRIYLDDAYVRRSENDLLLSRPVITSASATPATIILGEAVTLTAEVDSGPDDGMVKGQWLSNLEGPLGNSLDGQDKLTTQIILTKAGTHTLSLKVMNERGMESLPTTITITVIAPTASLNIISAQANGLPVSDKASFAISISDLPAQYSYSGILYTCNGDQRLGLLLPGRPLVLDTRRLSKGANKFYALLHIWRQGASAELTTIGTNTVTLTVANK